VYSLHHVPVFLCSIFFVRLSNQNMPKPALSLCRLTSKVQREPIRSQCRGRQRSQTRSWWLLTSRWI